ncbi:hypothetical protein K8Z37_12235 [Bacillus thuringiensis]|uniref:hypothetical protein n=1 Tax=Bacillus cereus group TaxID=86661 RepID=UPI0004129274|nr:hypothetical protein [Bacillus thuringiensis]MEB8984504.1 hypothetical protein [Bacillus cereus]MCC3998323.1 hypothetical protein [Bacillus thuringiensis]MEC3435581.1 hypothetical protein [Bacillus cereus]UEL09470.1 hypothetical protein K8Z38_22345 [Bacillus thuringiensis]HDR7051704.1 hypothetical protein [Bacillus thuringiensis]
MIKIIDEYSLVINSGLKDGISIGDSIEIFLEGDEIVDPFNEGKVLGTLDFIKDTLEVTEVYSEFAVCKKIITNEVHIPSPLQKALSHSMSGLSGITGTTETRITVKKIKIDESEITGRRKGDRVIRIGDIARIALSN